MNIMLLDMASLAFRREPDGSLTVSAPGLPEVARVQVPGNASDREVVFQALDGVLATARLAALGGWVPVGLVNPASCEVAVGPVPRTIAFGDGEPVAVPAGGLIVAMEDGDLVLPDGRRLEPIDESVDAVERALLAQRA